MRSLSSTSTQNACSMTKGRNIAKYFNSRKLLSYGSLVLTEQSG